MQLSVVLPLLYGRCRQVMCVRIHYMLGESLCRRMEEISRCIVVHIDGMQLKAAIMVSAKVHKTILTFPKCKSNPCCGRVTSLGLWLAFEFGDKLRGRLKQETANRG